VNPAKISDTVLKNYFKASKTIHSKVATYWQADETSKKAIRTSLVTLMNNILILNIAATNEKVAKPQKQYSEIFNF
jgi:phosphopantetheinyl transferase (holo-ACP synthase)